MKIDMIQAEQSVQEFKYLHNIMASLPHALRVEMWHHTSRPTTVECQVSIFTTQSHIEQGAGVSFKDALQEIELKIKEKALTLDTIPNLQVEVPECIL